jgi:hypothetical protein
MVACDDWPASAVLGHLAFWDRRAAWILRHWRAGWTPPDDPDWYRTDDLLNDSLAPLWQALQPDDAVRLALDAASEVDAEVEATDVALAKQIVDTGRDWLLNRWRHRSQHLDDIERALDLK